MITIEIPEAEWAALLAKFQGMAMKVKRELAFDALYQAVLPTVEAVRERAPIDQSPGAKHPGALKDSVGLVMRRYKTSVRAIIGPLRGFPDNPAATAHLVEYGHRVATSKTGKIKKGGIGGDAVVMEMVPAHPFMRPAWEATKDQVLPRLAKLLGRAIEVEMARKAFANTSELPAA